MLETSILLPHHFQVSRFFVFEGCFAIKFLNAELGVVLSENRLDLGIATDRDGVHLSSVLHHFHHIDAPCRYWRLDSGIGFTLLEWHKVTPPCFGWPVFSSNTIRFGQARPDCCGRWGWGHALHLLAVHACFRAGLGDQTWPGRSTFLLDLTRTNRHLDWGDDGRCMFDARFFLIQYYILYNINII